MDEVKLKLGPSFKPDIYRSSDPALNVVAFLQGTPSGTRTGWLIEALNGHVVAYTKSVGLAPVEQLGVERVLADAASRYGQPTYKVNADLHYLYDRDTHRLIPPVIGNDFHKVDACFFGAAQAGVHFQLRNGLTADLPAGVDPRCVSSMTLLTFSVNSLIYAYSFTVVDNPQLYAHNKQVHDEAMAKAKAAHDAQLQHGLPQ